MPIQSDSRSSSMMTMTGGGPSCAKRAPAGTSAGEAIITKKTKISSAQIRAARGLLNLSARRLSERSGISLSTIHRAESAEGIPSTHEASLAAIKAALEELGVEFLDDSGVRLGSNGASREVGQ